MLSNFTLHQPFVIASLPKTVGTASENYVVSEVYGGALGQKKRKRSELAVGINGEGVNLYDVSASRMITSYALPPQFVFSCPPSSLRVKISKYKVERRTYVTSVGGSSQITLFHDYKEGSGETRNRELSKDIKGSSSRVIFIGSVISSEDTQASCKKSEVIVVKEDCEIQCYDGDNLLEEWTSPPSAIFHDSRLNPDDAKVEFAQITNAYSAGHGILKSRKDVFAIFSQNITEDGFNPEILILITNSEKNAARFLHIVSLPQRPNQSFGLTNRRSVKSLLLSQLPCGVEASKSCKNATFSVHPFSGTMHHLSNNNLSIYDLVDVLPNEKYTVKFPGAQSFLRLSSTSIIISSENEITIYNPKFQSCLANLSLNHSGSETLKRKRDSMEVSNNTCRLLSYFPKLATIVALNDTNLIGIQMESQNDLYGRPRVTGLLIDSLGCSTKDHNRSGLTVKQLSSKTKNDLQGLKPIKQACLSKNSWLKLLRPLEDSFAKGECTAEVFDRFMEPYLAPKTKKSKKSFEIDRRWIIYALSKIFNLSETGNDKSRLSISFYAPNTVRWLIQRGHLTVMNIESGLRYRGIQVKSIPAGELTRNVMELDPEMELLRILINTTHIGVDELLYAILKLIQSLKLCESDRETCQKPRRFSSSETTQDSLREHIESLAARGGHIEQSGCQLRSRSYIPGKTLNLALAKLYTFSNDMIVCSLQKIFTPQAIVNLIYLLRLELARSGWTAKYLDSSVCNVDNEQTKTADNLIILISSLLNCCIDAICSVGWLSGETRLFNGETLAVEELISSLKIEISAALEGIEEMVYLQNILAEMVRYGDSIQRELTFTAEKDTFAPISLPKDQEIISLPIGLKVERQISIMKINSGGGVLKRSMRDIGDRKSRKVGKYSRERIIL